MRLTLVFYTLSARRSNEGEPRSRAIHQTKGQMQDALCFSGDFGPFVNAPAGHPDDVPRRGYDRNETSQGTRYLVINHEGVEALLVATQAQRLKTIAHPALAQHQLRAKITERKARCRTRSVAAVILARSSMRQPATQTMCRGEATIGTKPRRERGIL